MSREKRSEPIPAGQVLQKVFKIRGWKSALSRHRIIALWPKIVDATVARHARAEKLSGSTLHVVVDSSVWMNELAAIKNVLLEKVNARLEPGAAAITDLRFHQRSWARQNEPPLPVYTEPHLSEKDVRLDRQLLEPVRDDELKPLLKRILEKDRRLKNRRDE